MMIGSPFQSNQAVQDTGYDGAHPISPLTCTGVELSFVPEPGLPSKPASQAQTVHSASSARLHYSPLAMVSTLSQAIS